MKRDHIHAAKEEMKAQGKPVDEGSIAENLPEQEVRGRERVLKGWERVQEGRGKRECKKGEGVQEGRGSARREGGERKGEYVGNGRGGREKRV